MILEVLTWAERHRILCRKPRVIKINDETPFKHDNLVKDMFDTIVEHDITGLAANQVGRDLALLVLRLPTKQGEPHINVMINPTIISESETMCLFEDGNISVPDVYVDAERPDSIVVAYQTPEGDLKEVQYDGVYAFMVHHDIEVMNGNIFAKRLK